MLRSSLFFPVLLCISGCGGSNGSQKLTLDQIVANNGLALTITDQSDVNIAGVIQQLPSGSFITFSPSIEHNNLAETCIALDNVGYVRDSSLIATDETIQESIAENSTNGHIGLSKEISQRLNSLTGTDFFQSFQFEIQNARIESIDRATAINLIQQHRTASCNQAISSTDAQKTPQGVVTKALIADVKISWTTPSPVRFLFWTATTSKSLSMKNVPLGIAADTTLLSAAPDPATSPALLWEPGDIAAVELLFL